MMEFMVSAKMWIWKSGVIDRWNLHKPFLHTPVFTWSMHETDAALDNAIVLPSSIILCGDISCLGVNNSCPRLYLVLATWDSDTWIDAGFYLQVPRYRHVYDTDDNKSTHKSIWGDKCTTYFNDIKSTVAKTP